MTGVGLLTKNAYHSAWREGWSYGYTWALETHCLDLNPNSCTNDVTEGKLLYLSELQFSHL